MEVHGVKPVTSRDELAALGEELGIGADWSGDADEDRIGVDVDGDSFSDEWGYDPCGSGGDMYVTAWKDGAAVGAVNLLTLFTWAAAGILTESQSFQVREARDILGTWDLAREGCTGIDRERVLADQVRALLAILGGIAPEASRD